MATTHYAVLRVSADASAAQIKAAFRARAKETHPDLAPDGGGADAAEFKAVQRAYEVLRERGSRALYDSSLRVAERAPNGASGMEDFAAAWAWRAANQAESAERRAQREAERRRLDKEAAAWWAYEKAEAERMRCATRRLLLRLAQRLSALRALVAAERSFDESRPEPLAPRPSARRRC